jgi:predicted dehydrogenase
VSAVGVAVIGCGLIGARRAATAAADARTSLRLLVDTNEGRARDLAAGYGADYAVDWHSALERADIGAVVVSTPNALIAPVATAALARGRHVLIEKPMGRNRAEAEQISGAAAAAGKVLKVGFNHRYHPAVAQAAERLHAGEIGRLIHMRARYGHGSRPGCEREWRGDPERAGGGELLDQGVHIIDIFQWLAGLPTRVHAEVQTAVWPLGRLEDNAFALMRFDCDVIGQLHVSMTQWKNLFSLELHGELGALVVEGLGGSYGDEQLTLVRRNLAGGVPEVQTSRFEGPDPSWQEEWSDFAAALHGEALRHGSAAEGVAVMRTVASLYAAAAVDELPHNAAQGSMVAR